MNAFGALLVLLAGACDESVVSFEGPAFIYYDRAEANPDYIEGFCNEGKVSFRMIESGFSAEVDVTERHFRDQVVLSGSDAVFTLEYGGDEPNLLAYSSHVFPPDGGELVDVYAPSVTITVPEPHSMTLGLLTVALIFLQESRKKSPSTDIVC